jgi:hypothetical protein
MFRKKRCQEDQNSILRPFRQIMAILIVAAVAGCAQGGPPSGLPTWSKPLTDPSDPSDLGHLASLEGVLVLDGGCLKLDTGAALAWPDETEWNQGTGEVTLNGVTAAVGDAVRMTGFESARTQWTKPPTEECAQERWWSVETLRLAAPEASSASG